MVSVYRRRLAGSQGRKVPLCEYGIQRGSVEYGVGVCSVGVCSVGVWNAVQFESMEYNVGVCSVGVWSAV
jgi:hypothetical protein